MTKKISATNKAVIYVILYVIISALILAFLYGSYAFLAFPTLTGIVALVFIAIMRFNTPTVKAYIVGVAIIVIIEIAAVLLWISEVKSIKWI